LVLEKEEESTLGVTQGLGNMEVWGRNLRKLAA
jgi:hypothetical protein